MHNRSSVNWFFDSLCVKQISKPVDRVYSEKLIPLIRYFLKDSAKFHGSECVKRTGSILNTFFDIVDLNLSEYLLKI